MGSRKEREFLKDIEELGWKGLRAPASGSRPDSASGDIWVVGESVCEHSGTAVSKTELYIIEEKYASSSKYVYENEEKADNMIEFAESIGATPVLAFRWSTHIDGDHSATHYCLDARKAKRTSSGNISASAEEAVRDYEPVEKFFSDKSVIASD